MLSSNSPMTIEQSGENIISSELSPNLKDFEKIYKVLLNPTNIPFSIITDYINPKFENHLCKKCKSRKDCAEWIILNERELQSFKKPIIMCHNGWHIGFHVLKMLGKSIGVGVFGPVRFTHLNTESVMDFEQNIPVTEETVFTKIIQGLIITSNHIMKNVEKSIQLKKLYNFQKERMSKLVQNYMCGELIPRKIAEDEKMAAFGYLAGGVAHEFNNLLMVIQGYAHQVKNSYNGNAKAIEKVIEIEKCIADGAKMTRKILRAAKREKSNNDQIDINATIREVKSEINYSQRSICIESYLTIHPIQIDGDFQQLKQVITEIVTNSCQAMPDGGSVVIESKVEKLQVGEIEGFPSTLGKFCRISITDHGCGIDPKEIKNVLSPFYTTGYRENLSCKGLGLTSVYGIVKNHNGYLVIKSTVGKGTKVYVYLPCCKTPKILI